MATQQVNQSIINSFQQAYGRPPTEEELLLLSRHNDAALQATPEGQYNAQLTGAPAFDPSTAKVRIGNVEAGQGDNAIDYRQLPVGYEQAYTYDGRPFVARYDVNGNLLGAYAQDDGNSFFGGIREGLQGALASPVGAVIVGALTGGLGGLSGIGGALSGGALTGAGASALGGAAVGGLTSGLAGGNVIKGAALGGLGAGLGASGLGNSLLGEAGGSALRGGLLGGANAAISGGDIGQGLLGGALRGGLNSAGNQLVRGFNYGADPYDFEPNSFPPGEGDTFSDQTDYFALTPDNLRIRAESVVNDPNSTQAQIDQAIADFQRASDLSRMASPFNTEGAYRVDVKGVGQEIPSLPFSIGGLLSDDVGIGASGGAGGFQQVPNVARPTQPGQPASTAKGPNLNLGGLLGLLGGGAVLGGLLSDSGGSGGSVPAMAQPQRNYSFDPRVNQYPGDPKTYGQVDNGNFRFYEPGLKVS